MFNFKRNPKNNERGLSVLELMTGMVIFIAVSIGVTSLIITSNQQVAQSTETAYINNQITVASQLIGREISQATEIISVENNNTIILESGKGTTTVITSTKIEPSNSASQCKVNITKYAANGVTVIEDSEVVSGLENTNTTGEPSLDCQIFSGDTSKVTLSLQVKSSNEQTYAATSTASTGYYSGTSDVGGFQVAAVIAAPNGLGTLNGIDVIGRNNIELSWEPVANATNYVLQASTDGVSWYIVNAYILNSNFNAEGLVPETQYFFRVAAQSAEGIGEFSETYNATTLPGSVTSAPVVVADPSPQSIAVSWQIPSDNGGYRIDGYKIRYKLSSGTEWIEITTDGSTYTYSIFGLEKYTEYDVQVTALNFKGYSNAGQPNPNPVRTLATPPSTPNSFDVQPNVNGTSVTAAWDVPLDNGGVTLMDYEINYKLTSSQTWQTLSLTTDLTKTISGLTKHANYDFRLRAVNDAGASDWTTRSITTSATTPDAPTIIAATDVTPTGFTANWTAPTDKGGFDLSVSEYRVKITLGGTLISQYVLEGNVLSYTFTNLTRGTTYGYTVEASNSLKGFGSADSDTQKTSILPPNAPVLSLASKTNNTVTLSWAYPTDDGGSPVTGYNVYNGSTKVNTTPITGTTYVVTGLTELTSYTFYVAAINAHPTEGDKQTTGTSVTTNPNPPCTPTGLQLDSYGSTSLKFSWDTPCGVIDSYKIYLNGSFIGNLNNNTYTFTDLTPSTQYTIGVSSTNVTGDSSTATLTKATSSGPVTNLTVSSTTATGANLSWTAPNGSVASYKIYIIEDNGSNPTPVYLTSTTSTNYSFSGLTQNTNYVFGVVPVNSYSVTSDMSTATGTTTPSAVTSLTVTNRTSSAISISWVKPTIGNGTITGFKIYVNDTLVTSLAPTATTYDVTTYNGSANLVSNTYYDIKVTAVNSAGEGTSSTVNAKTRVTIPSAPTVTVSNTDWNNITVTWTKPSGVIDGYKVYIIEGTTGTPQLLDIVMNPNTLTYTFGSGLLYGNIVGNPALKDTTAYRIGVVAANGITNDGGDSPMTVKSTSTTIRPPVNVTASNPSKTGITLNWGCKADATPVLFNINLNGTFLTSVDATLGCASNAAASPVMYSYNLTNLTEGTSYSISVSTSLSDTIESNYVAVSSATLASAPTSLTQVDADSTDTAVKVSWTAPSGNGITGYKVYQDGQYIATTTNAFYTFTGLSGSTAYSITVKAVTAGGDSVASTALSAKTRPAASVISQLGNQTTTEVSLQWTKPSGTLTGYRVEYKLSTGSTWTPVSIASGNTLNTVISGLTAGKAYNFRVYALGISGYESAVSNTLTITTLLGAPTTVTVGTTTVSTIPVSWSAVTDAASYNVYLDGTYLTNVVGTSTTISTLNYGKSYTIGVKTVNSAGLESSNITTTTGTTVTAAPASVTVTSVTNSSVTISWTAPTGTGTPSGYKIYDGSTLITTVSAATGTYTLNSRTGGTSYSGATAIGVATTVSTGGTESAKTTASYLTTPDAATLASYTSTTSTVTVNWNAPSGTVTGYRVYKNGVQVPLDSGTISYVGSSSGTTSASLTALAGGSRPAAQAGDLVVVVASAGVATGTVDPNPISITSSGYTLIANLTSNAATAGGDDLYMDVGYKYLTAADTSVTVSGSTSVIAYVFSGVSSTNPIDVASTIVNDVLMKPTPGAITPVTSGAVILSAVGIGSDTASATWTNASLTGVVSATSSRTSIGIGRYTSWTSGAYTPPAWTTTDADPTGSGAAVTIALRPATANAATVTGLTSNTSYNDISVVAYNDSGEGPALNPTLLTKPDAPTSLSVTTTETTATLSWTAPSGSNTSGYKIYRDGVQVGTATAGATSYVFTGLTGSTAYTFGVAASNSSGDGTTATLSGTTRLAAPTGLAINSATTTTSVIGISFTSPAGTKTGYKIYVDGVLNKTVADATSSAAARTDTITALDFGKTYAVSVVYYYLTEDGTASSSVSMSTLMAAPATAVQNGGTNNGTTYSAVINWTAPVGLSGTIGAYRVYVGGVQNGADLSSTTLTKTLTGLTVGTTYAVTVSAVSAEGIETLAASRTAVTTAATAVTTSAATSVGNTTATLNWTAKTAESGYRLYNGGTLIATLPIGTTSYSLTGLTAGTTYASATWKIASFNVNGEGSLANLPAFTTLLGASTTPTLSSATTTSITIAFTSPAGVKTSYDVYVDNVKVTTTAVADVTTAATARTYTVSTTNGTTGLSFGKNYSIRVVYNNATGAGTSSASASLATLTPAPATAAQTGGDNNGTTYSAVITWTAPSGTGTVSNYRVYVDGVQNGADLSSATLTKTITGLTVGTTYAVTVSAVSADGIETVSASRTAVSTAATTVTTTAATNIVNTSTTTATLNWTAKTAESGYRIYNGATLVATIPLGTTSYNLTGLTTGTTYAAGAWTIKSFNVNGEGTAANFPAFTTFTTAPTLSSTTSTTTSITLNWANLSGATGYNVYNGATKLTTTALANTVLTYNVTGLTANTIYSDLRITAINTAGESVPLIVTASTSPTVPTGLTVSNITTTGMRLSWTAPTGNATTGYNVYLNGGLVAGNLSTSTLSYDFTGLTSGVSYTLGVATVNASGTSATASSAATVTLLGASTTPTRSSATTSTITIAFTSPAGVKTGYNVYVDNVKVTTTAVADTTTAATARTYTVSTTNGTTGLSFGKNYSIRVVYSNASGAGTSSTAATLATLTAAPATAVQSSGDNNGSTYSAVINWTAPAGTGTVSAYRVYVAGVQNGADLSSATLTKTITGLTVGSIYDVTVGIVTPDGIETLPASRAAVSTVATGVTISGTNYSDTQSSATTSTATLYWTANTAESGYRIYNGATLVATLPIGTTSYNLTGLTSGTTYSSFTIKSFNVNGESTASAFSFTTLLEAPTGLAINSATTTSSTIGFSFTAPTGLKSGYNVYVDGVNAGFVIDTADGVIQGTLGGLQFGKTYSISIGYVTVGVGNGIVSNAVNMSTFMATPATAVQNGGDNNGTTYSAVINWTAPSGTGTVSAYRVYVGGVQNGADLTPATLTKTITGLTVGTTYSVQIAAVSSEGIETRSTDRQLVSTTATTVTTTAATSVGTTTGTLNWTAKTAESGYRLYNGGTLIATLPIGTTSYNLTGLTAGTTYASATWKIASFNVNGEGSLANLPAFTTLLGASTTPTLIGATTSTITIGFTSPAGVKTSYDVYVDNVKVTTTAVADTTTAATARTYTVSTTNGTTGLAFGKNYSIRVVYNNATGAGTSSASASLATLTPAPATAAQTGGDNNGTTYSAVITWTAPTGTGTVSGYNVYVNNVKSNTSLVTGLTYTVTGLTLGSGADVKVGSVSADGIETVSGSRITVLTTPTVVTTTATTNIVNTSTTTATLNWVAKTAESGYRIYNGATLVATLPIGTTSYNLTGLSSGTTYAAGAWTIQSFNVTGGSTAANFPAFTTFTNAPTLSSTTSTSTSITLNWTAPSGTVTGYNVYNVDTKLTTTALSSATLTYTVTGLANNTIYDSLYVIATNAAGDSLPLTVTASTSPATPTGLTVSNITTTGMRLSWTAPAGDATTGYNMYLNGGIVASNISSSSTYYDFTGLTAGTSYTLGVATVNASGTSSAASSASTVTLLGASTTPTLSSATTTSITIAFTSPAGTKTGYNVYVDNVKVTTTAVTDTTTAATARTYTVSTTNGTTALSYGKNYSIRVVYSNASGAGTSSTAATLGTLTPAPATALQNGGDNNGTTYSAVINWTAPSGTGTVSAYRVYVDGVQNGADLTSATLTKTLTGLTVGTTYVVKVSAVSADGIETVSASRTTVTTTATTVTTTATTNITAASATLNWTAKTAESGYRLYNGATLLSTLPIGTTSYNLTGLSVGTDYSALTIKSFNVNGEGTAATFSTFTTLLAAPTALAINTATTTVDTIGISFTSPSGTKTGYKIYVDGVLNKTVADTTTAATARTDTITGLDFGKTYAISVAYYNASGEGSVSSAVNMSTLMAAPATAVQNGGDNNGTTYSAVINWTAPTGTGTVANYRVYVDGVQSGADLSSATLTKTLTGLTVGTTYAVTVSAVSTEAIETLSASRTTVITTATTVTTSAATNVLDVSATLNWTATTADSGYNIYYGTTLLATLPSGTTSYDISSVSTSGVTGGLVAGTTYDAGTWTIKSFNVNGEGTAASFPSITTLLGAPVLSGTSSTTSSINVNWTKPSGSSITGYKIYKGGVLQTTYAATENSTVVSSPASAVAFRKIATDGNGNYVAIPSGATTQLYKSTDGLTWSLCPHVFGSSTFTDITYGNGVWVALRGQTTGVFSTNGCTTFGTTGTISSTVSTNITYLPNLDKFVASAVNSAAIATPSVVTAGTAWTSDTTYSIGSTSVIAGYDTANGKMIYGSSGTNTLYYDPMTSGTIGTGGTAGTGTMGKATMLATSDSGITIAAQTSTTTAYISSNATSWSSVTLPVAPVKISFLNGLFVVVSSSNMYTSATGATGSWTQVTGLLPAFTWNDVEYINGNYIFYASNASIYTFDASNYSYNFTGLNSNTTYSDMQIVAYNAGGDGAPLNVTATTLAPAPTLPTASVSSVTKTQATLTWNSATTGARTGYKVWLNGSLVSSSLSASDTSYTFTGLTAGNTYTLGVTATTAGGDSAITTASVTTLLGAATSLTVNPATTTSSVIGISFTSPAGVKTAYDVYVDNSFFKTVTDTTTAATARTDTITGLAFGKNYNIKIVYKNVPTSQIGTTNGDFTSNVQMNTLAAAPATAVQNGGSWTSGGAGWSNGTATAVINWTAPTGTGTVANYRVYVDGVQNGADLSSATLTKTLTGLSVGGTYAVTVSVVSADGYETPVASRTLVTTVPPTITTNAASGLSASSTTTATLNWTADPTASGYIISSNMGLPIATVDASVTTYNLTGLDSGTTYPSGSWQIASFNVNGQSGNIAFPEFTTYINTPVKNSTASGTSSILVSWNNASGDTITGYKVYKGGVLQGTVTNTNGISNVGTTPVAFSKIINDGAGHYLAAPSGLSTKIYYSGDGVTWTASTTTFVSSTFSDIAVITGFDSYGTTLWLTIQGGSLRFSTDFGATWTATGGAAPGGNNITYVASQGKIYLVGLNMVYATSLPTTGVWTSWTPTWTSDTTYTNGTTLVTSIYDSVNARLISVSSGSATAYHDSLAGNTFASSPAIATGGVTANLIANNGAGRTLIANTASTAGAVTTTATSWTAATLPAIPNDIMWLNGSFVLVSGTSMYTSTTGATGSWTLVSSSLPALTWTEVEYLAGGYVFYASTAAIHSSIPMYSVSGLSANTAYSDITITAYNGTGESLPMSFTASTTPAALSGLTVTGTTTTTATISWTAPSGSGLTGYTFYVNGSSVGFTSSTANTYTFTGLTAGTSYNLGVVAVSAGGTGTIVNTSALTKLTAATGLAINSATTTTSVIGISFTSPTGTKTGYKIYVDGTLNKTVADATSAATARTDTITGLNYGKNYSISVVYYNASGDGTSTSSVVMSTLMAAPATAVQTSGNYTGPTGTAVVTWTAPSGTGTVSAYRVYASGVQSGADLPSTTLTKTLTGINPDYTYSITVSAVSADGIETPLASRTAVTTTATPVTTGATSNITDTSATLNWTANTAESGYRIYNGATLLATLPIGTTSYNLTGLSVGTDYSALTIKSWNLNGASTASTFSTFTTLLAAPTGLAIDNATTTTSVLGITFTSPAGTKTGYKIYVDGVLNKTVADAISTSTVRNDTVTGLDFGKTYAISVRYYNSSGDGAVASSVNMSTLMAAPATAVQTSGNYTGPTGTAVITWTAPAGTGTVSAYRVYSGGVQYGTDLSSTTLTNTLTGINPDYIPYAITVSAVSAEGIETPLASRTAVTTTATTVTTTAATSVGTTTATLNWTAKTAESGYRIYNGATLVATLPIGTTSYNLTGLTTGTTYAAGAWTIKSWNVNGESTATNFPAFTTLLGASTTPTLSSATTTSITIAFTSPAGIKTSYDVYVDNVKVTTTAVADVTTAATARTYTVTTTNGSTALAFGKNYSIRVVYNNATGAGTSSTAATLGTLTPAPATVAQTGGDNNGSTYSAAITWTAPTGTGTVSSYKVYTNGANPVTVTAPTLTTTLSGLAVGTTYAVTIAAVSADGIETASASRISVATAATTVTTAAATNIVNTSTTTATLNWTAKTAESGYRIYNGATLVATIPLGTTSYNLTGLTSGTTYAAGAWTIKSFNVNGEGTAANFPAFTTFTNAPTLSSTTSTTTSITLNWTAPSGTVTGYNVYNGVTKLTTTALANTVLTYNVTGLTANTIYDALKVTAINAAGESVPLTVTASTSPTIPTGLTVSNITTSSMRLSWTAPTGNATTGYDVFLNGSPIASNLSTSTLFYDFTGLTAGTSYTLGVDTNNASGSSATASSAATVTLLGAATTPALSTSTTTSITIAFTSPAGVKTSYDVYVDNVKVTTTAVADVTTAATARTYTVSTTNGTTGLSFGKNYSIRVVYNNASGAGTSSTASTLNTLMAAPATAVQNGGTNDGTNYTAVINWTAPSGTGTVSNYRVYVDGVQNGADLTSATLTKTLTGLVRGTTYVVKVSAVSADGIETPSASRTTVSTLPTIPTVGAAATNISATGATLNWTGSTADSGYIVQQGSLNVFYYIASGASGSQSLTGLTPNTIYAATWKVASYNVNGTSAQATLPSFTTLPDAVTGLTKPSSTTTSVNLTWDAPTGTGTIQNYDVQYSTSGTAGTWASLAVAPTTNSATITGLTANTKYFVRVAAKNTANASYGAYSSEITVYTTPDAPVMSTTTNYTTSGFTVSWTPPSGSTTGIQEYVVYKNGGSEAMSVPYGTNSYTFTGLTAGTSYQISVRAVSVDYYNYNFSGTTLSALATASTIATTPSDPASLSRGGRTATTYTLNWNGATANPNATYKVYLDGTAVQSGGVDVTVAGGVGTYTFTGLTAGTSYTFGVRAFTNSLATSSALSTLADKTTLAPVTGLTVGTITSTSIAVSWTPPAAPAGKTSGTITGVSGTSTYIQFTATNTFTAGEVVTVSGTTSSADTWDMSGTITVATSTYFRIAGNYTNESAIRGTFTGGGTATTPGASNVTGYKIYINGVYSTTVSSSPTTVSGLNPGSDYTIGVAASNADSDSITVSTPYVTTTIAAPTSLAASSVTDSNMTVSWTAPTGTPTGYKVYLNSSFLTTVFTNSVNLNGLSGGTSYSITVSALKGSAESSQSTALVQSTTNGVVSGFNYTVKTPTSVQLRWEAPASPASYTGDYWIFKDGVFVTNTLGNTNYNATGLTAGTTYTFGISTVSSSAATISSTITVTTPVATVTVGTSVTTMKYMVFGNGVFIAVPTAAGTTAYCSTDGITWVNQTLPRSAAWGPIAYDATMNKWLIIPTTGGGTAALSTGVANACTNTWAATAASLGAYTFTSLTSNGTYFNTVSSAGTAAMYSITSTGASGYADTTFTGFMSSVIFNGTNFEGTRATTADTKTYTWAFNSTSYNTVAAQYGTLTSSASYKMVRAGTGGKFLWHTGGVSPAYYSATGTGTWTSTASLPSVYSQIKWISAPFTLGGVSYPNGALIGIGTSANVAVSTTGQTWTTVTSALPSASTWVDVDGDHEKLVFITNTGVTAYVYNTTGLSASTTLTPTFASVSASGASYNLSWTAITGVTGYNVYLNGSYIGQSATNSYTGLVLPLGKTSSITVRGYFDSMLTTGKSATVTVSRGQLDAPAVTLGATTASSAILNWTAPTATSTQGTRTGYKVYLDGTYITTLAQGSTSYTFSGLTTNKSYVISVQAINGVSDGFITSYSLSAVR